MILRDSSTCPHRRVIDRSVLCELLHPAKVAGCGALSCSVAHAIVPPGEATLPHRLRTSTELYYILGGTGRMRIGTEIQDVRAGQVLFEIESAELSDARAEQLKASAAMQLARATEQRESDLFQK